MEKNKKIFLTIFVFSLIILALIIFGVWPLIEGIKKDSEDLISAKNNIKNFNAQSIEVENFKNNYENYKTNLEKIDDLFVDVVYPVDFIKFLEEASSVCEINMQVSMRPALNVGEESVSNFTIFQLSLKGDFSNILSFINKIEFGPYLIEVKDLTIQNQEGDKLSKDSKQPLYKNGATLNIKVFTKNETEI
jgi:hypothetical protein